MTGTPAPAQLLYLEPDDEITSVVRRLREAEPGRVVLVASGRSKATTSAVALRLLAAVAAEEGREIAIVADATGRSLAAEAGIPAFASVSEASAEGAEPVPPPPTPRAPIRVVRSEPALGAALPPETEVPAPGDAAAQPEDGAAAVPAAPAVPQDVVTARGDETQAVSLPRPAPSIRTPRPARGARRAAGIPFRRRLPRVAIAVVIGLFLLAGAALAAVAPAATIVIRPATVQLDPVTYTLTMQPSGTDQGELTAQASGTATGVHTDPTPATGEVTFFNYNTSPVRVAAGTRVAAGAIVFETTETIVVPTGFFTVPGTARSGVTAVDPGPAANLSAGAIETVLDEAVRNALRAFSDNPNRIVRNEEATTGGDNHEEPEISQEDVNAAVATIQGDLVTQLQERMSQDPARVYGPADAGDPVVNVPGDLVGTTGQESFDLSGTLSYRRDYVPLDAVVQAARERLALDDFIGPEGIQVLADAAQVEVGDVTEVDGQLRVQATVRAEAVPSVDVDAVRNQVAGMTKLQVVQALGSLGDVSVTLWPGWVDHVPQLTWRIDVRVEGEPSPSPGASPSAEGSSQ